MPQIFLNGKVLLPNNDDATSLSVLDHIKSEFNVKGSSYYLLQNGHIVRNDTVLTEAPIHVVPRVLGGKGGFGSMLRAIGAQIEKTTNREACRDLSGRRLRDINEEKRLKKWIAEKADREKEAIEKKKKKMEKLAQEPKHEFTDTDYDKVRSEMIDKVHSAVEEGLKAAACSSSSGTSSTQPSTSHGVKRKDPPSRKGLLWMDADELGSDLSDSDEDNDQAEDNVKKVKV